MRRNLPVALLELLQNWLKTSSQPLNGIICFQMFAIKFEVRQGSVLSPFLLAIYLDDILITRSLILSDPLLYFMLMTYF